MIIAYGGGLTLSLYPIVNPIKHLQKSLEDNERYKVEDCGSFIKVSYSNKFITNFIGLWDKRTHSSEVDLFKKILENIYFESRLNETGYFEAILKTESAEVEKIYAQILANTNLKQGFLDELETHFKDIYEFVYIKTHNHTYMRLYEIFCHVVLNEGKFDLDDAKNNVSIYLKNISIFNLIKPVMGNMDAYEKEVQNRSFVSFLRNDILHIFDYYAYVSNRIIYLRKSIWALNYLKTCFKPLEEMDGFVLLLSSRKEVIEAIKNAIGYYVSLASTILGFFGVILALMNVDKVIIAIILMTILILLLYSMQNSIKSECGKI